MLPQKQGALDFIGQSLGQGIGGGLQEGIQGYLTKKSNTESANALADNLGFKGQQKQSLVSMLANIPAADQPKAIEQFATSQILAQYLQGQQGQQQGQIPQGQSSQQGMGSQQPIQPVPPIGPLKGISEMQQKQEELRQKKEIALGKQHHEIAKDTLKDVATKASGLPQKQMALDSLREAIQERNLGFFSPDNLAELTGIEGLRSPEGALFKTASKEFFLGNLSRVGAKGINQWIERQVSDMAQKIGRSTEANLVVTEALQADLDVEKKQIELTNRIADEMEKKYGYVRRDLTEQVLKELTPYAVEKQKELKSKIEEIRDKYRPATKEGVLMYDPVGNLRRVPANQIKEAKKANYREYK